MGYTEDLKISLNTLEVNLMEQAGLYMKYSELWLNAVFDRDQRKRYLDLDIRENFADYGFAKYPSEAAILARISSDDQMIELEREVNRFKSARTAFEHRRYALEGLCKLFTTGYFTNEDLPKGLRPSAVDDYAAGTDDLRSRLKR